MLSFVLDLNLGPPACDESWKSILSAPGVVAHPTADSHRPQSTKAITHKDLDHRTHGTLFDVLLSWELDWSGIYGAPKYYYADVHPFFRDLDQLPADT
jgi:hypothetical protein